jgi:hypothetical protein
MNAPASLNRWLSKVGQRFQPVGPQGKTQGKGEKGHISGPPTCAVFATHNFRNSQPSVAPKPGEGGSTLN